MLAQHIILSLIAAVAAVPLNINLGAYSPALVVGDGEISLGSTASASELMATLASGANANAERQQAAAAQGQQQEAAVVPAPVEAAPAPVEATPATPAEPAPAAKREVSFGKRAPVAANDKIAAVEGAMQWIKRDLDGFNAALTFAREAMKNSPKIELGTGGEGSGVGLIVNAGVNVPADSAANGVPVGEKAKRSEVVAEESETPKMTLVAITEV